MLFAQVWTYWIAVQPGGGARGEGSSPFSTMRSRLRMGSGVGVADSNAFV